MTLGGNLNAGSIRARCLIGSGGNYSFLLLDFTDVMNQSPSASQNLKRIRTLRVCRVGRQFEPPDVSSLGHKKVRRIVFPEIKIPADCPPFSGWQVVSPLELILKTEDEVTKVRSKLMNFLMKGCVR